MAKKVKTPEELQAKIDKKISKRKIFFGTFTKSLAFFLAIAMAYSLAVIAFTPAVAPATTAPTTGGQSTDKVDDPFASIGGNDPATPGTDDPATPGTDDPANPGTKDPATPGTTDKVTAADGVKLLNEVTAAAAKGNYTWSRSCNYTSDGKIKVTTKNGKDATGVVNNFIQGFDKNANLESVVGGFLGIGDAKADIKGGKFQGDDEWRSTDNLIKGMALTEGDVERFQNKGNSYIFQLKACDNPQKDGSNPLSKATNDFLTENDVREGLKSSPVKSDSLLKSTQVSFDPIYVTATIADGKLTSLKIDYTFSAALNLNLVVTSVDGKGKAKTVIEYTNISY